jgi:hypothetical protein
VPLTDCELAVHVFAPATGPASVAAYDHLVKLWSRCRSELGMSDPITDARAPTEPMPDPGSASGLLAAAQRPGDDVFQAILRGGDGVLTLSVILSPTGSDSASWSELEALWDPAGDGCPPEIMGECRLFLAKTARPSVQDVSRHLPAAGPLWDCGTITRDGVLVNELSPREDARATRRIIVLAKTGHDADLSGWAWSRGDLAPTPFTRYLMHAAELRYELRAWAAGEWPRRLRRDIDAAVNELIAVLPAGLVEPDRDVPDPTAIISATGRVTDLLAAQTGVVFTATRLREMLRTVEITRDNMAAVADRQALRGRAPTLFTDDRDLAVSLEQRLADDIAYLDAARDRARDVTSFGDQVLRRLASEREDAGRKRQERLTVLQTAITGSILMVLTAVMALGYHLAVPSRVAPAVIAFLGALTLALSTRVFGVRLTGRSHGLTGLDVLAWGATTSTAVWLLVSAAGNVRLGDLTVTATTVAISVATFAVSAAAYARMPGRR